MSGDDVLRQVRGALDNIVEFSEHEGYGKDSEMLELLAALDGCVLLTRKEADMLVGAINGIYNLSGVCESLALLTPAKEGA